eukprot:15145840-Ditylum_brightwellii.AAC.1
MLAATNWLARHWAQLMGNPEWANSVPRAVQAFTFANQPFLNPGRTPSYLVHSMAFTLEQEPLMNLLQTHVQGNDLLSICKWLSIHPLLSKPQATGQRQAVIGDSNDQQQAPVEQPHLPGTKKGGEQ